MKKIKENLDKIIPLCLCGLVLFWIYGCESTVQSLNGSKKKVTRSELHAELDWYLQIAELRFQQLDQQDKFKQTVFQQAFIIAETGSVNPLGVLTTIGTILGIGAVIDDRKIRKKLKNGFGNPTANTG